ncbi:MAG TPA: hypothetical protein PLC19_06380, partial [Marmoricola sp.]|nr:hypothetical protein [Marmoricola sp.]
MLLIFDRARSARGLTLALFDGASWVIGFLFVAWLQMYVNYETSNLTLTALTVGTVCGLTQVALSRLFRLHQGRAQIASFDDAVNVGAVWMSIFIVVITLGWFAVIPVRISVVATAPVVAICVMLGGRVGVRLLRQHALKVHG